MRATGWHNGTVPLEPAGYGIKFLARDRDASFESDWSEIVLEIEGRDPITVPLMPSFWRKCSEVRSPELGQWLISAGAAPWAKGNPPGIIVRRVGGNHFSARIQSPSLL
jgi:hypothetical protein